MLSRSTSIRPKVEPSSPSRPDTAYSTRSTIRQVTPSPDSLFEALERNLAATSTPPVPQLPALRLSIDSPFVLAGVVEQKDDENDKPALSHVQSSQQPPQQKTHATTSYNPSPSPIKRSGRVSPPKRQPSQIPLATHSMAPINRTLVSTGSNHLPPHQRPQLTKRQSRVTMVKRPETPSPVNPEQRRSLYAPLGAERDVELEREREKVRELRRVKSEESPRTKGAGYGKKDGVGGGKGGGEWVSNFTFTPEDKRKKMGALGPLVLKTPDPRIRVQNEFQGQAQEQKPQSIQDPEDPNMNKPVIKKQDRLSRYLRSRTSVAMMDKHANVPGFQFPPDAERKTANLSEPHLRRPKGHLDQEEGRLDEERKGWPYGAVEEEGTKEKKHKNGKKKEGWCACIVM